MKDTNFPKDTDFDNDGYTYPTELSGATVLVEPGGLHTIVDESEKVLAGTDRYFNYNGTIVALCIDNRSGSAIIKPATPNTLTLQLSRCARYIRNTDSGEKVIDPPPRAVSMLHESTEHKFIPQLDAISLQPYFRSDGTLVVTRGYDSQSQIYGNFDKSKYRLNGSPTREEAKEALDHLLTLLEEFEYEENFDRSAALSAILTAAVRPSLQSAPLYHVKAHMPGSGKSYQSELIACFASPEPAEPLPFPTSETECQKELLAALKKSPRVLVFDNLTTDLVDHASLALAMTNEKMSGRILGVSRMAIVGTRCLFLSSGNNVSPVGDMVRRVVQISLSPQSEQPANRKYQRPKLVSEVRENRQRYVSAALTIVLAYRNAKSPDVGCKPLNGYEDWSRLCRQPLIWLGLSDPATSTLALMNENPGRALLGQFISLVSAKFGHKPFTVKALVETAKPELVELIEEIACDDRDRISKRKLGWWLKKHIGQIVDKKLIAKIDVSNPAKYQIDTLPDI